MDARPLLAIDTASPVVSVALAVGGHLLATREGGQRESSSSLIGWIDDCLRQSEVTLADLAGAVALRGPGSFTGLRVGLATLLGFHQAIGLRVAGLPTLQVLAAAASEGTSAATHPRGVLALVPAGFGEWFAQPFDGTWPPAALGPARRVPEAELLAELPGANELAVVATDEERLRLAALPIPVRSSGALAPVAARLSSLHAPAWDAAELSKPLYLAPPPVTVPGAPKRVLPPEPGGRR